MKESKFSFWSMIEIKSLLQIQHGDAKKKKIIILPGITLTKTGFE
jgi:hypothetical protein